MYKKLSVNCGMTAKAINRIKQANVLFYNVIKDLSLNNKNNYLYSAKESN